MLRARPRSVTSPRRGLRPGLPLRATPLREGSLNDRNEALFSKGLRDTRLGPGSVCIAIEVGVVADGHHDDGDPLGLGALPEDPADLVAVHPRHLEIQEDDVRRVGVGQGEPIHAARRSGVAGRSGDQDAHAFAVLRLQLLDQGVGLLALHPDDEVPVTGSSMERGADDAPEV